MSNQMVYKAVDRSLLLPLYKRLLIAPFLRFIPASIHPNSITHAGHLLALAGTATLLLLWPKSGWPFALASVLLQAYCWCDNADGAHARRTGQSSNFGEFLDHSLDAFSVSYIALLTCMSLGAAPGWWVLIAVLIPGAGATVYWEQSLTGIFQLGTVNQIESLTALSGALMASALFGTAWPQMFAYGGVSIDQVLLTWTAGTIVIGMLHGFYRVKKALGWRALLDYAPAVAVQALVVVVGLTGALGPVAAVAVGIVSNVFIGLRMLNWRVQGKKPESLGLLWVVAAALLAVQLFGPQLVSAWPAAQVAIAGGICSLLAALVAIDLRAAIATLRRKEEAAPASGGATGQA